MISSFEYGKVFFNRLANQQLANKFYINNESSDTPYKVPNSNVNQFKDKEITNNSTNKSSQGEIL
ncbi:hypothetical protein NQ314_000099 [Rhamnusium bicolor]|uniref:Uncharacterized protein n=1 Tax=Rhamnusium bicolor TaxID=1586634 RepID=A0AAV8ZZ72_9CUCU|nr:hypothetical protein NQ314_000099 [Rhamnusium bicolor]